MELETEAAALQGEGNNKASVCVDVFAFTSPLSRVLYLVELDTYQSAGDRPQGWNPLAILNTGLQSPSLTS